MIGHADVEAAATRIQGYVRRTPAVSVEDAQFGQVSLKLETIQITGSFKPRGVFNRILSAVEAGQIPDSGVIAASGGNAGLAIAHAARILKLRSEIFVPETTPAAKTEGLRTLGANVVVTGRFYPDALEASIKRSAETDALVIHAYDQPEVAAGQGTIALELIEQAPDIDTVLVAVGGGGLLAGVVAALDGRLRVVAVEPVTIPTLYAALAHEQPVDVDVSGVAADSLGARRVSQLACDLAMSYSVHSVLVPDTEIINARNWLWDHCRIAAEYGAAAPLAALHSGAYRPEPGEKVAAIVCGANTDPSDLGHHATQV